MEYGEILVFELEKVASKANKTCSLEPDAAWSSYTPRNAKGNSYRHVSDPKRQDLVPWRPPI